MNNIKQILKDYIELINDDSILTGDPMLEYVKLDNVIKSLNIAIFFEIGDITHCPYYQYTGVIKEFKNANGMDYVILHNPNKPIEHICCTKLRTESVNGLRPMYLQLVCKKADYEAINKNKIFGHS